HISWIDSEEIERKGAKKILSDADAIIAPGGFGKHGTLGIVEAIRYARENKIPFLGICLGMQLSLIEIARNVLKLKGADSTELIPDTPYPVIDIMQDNKGVGELGDTLRLGSYPCVLDKNSKIYKLYRKTEVAERHRNRYEENNDYREAFEKKGVVFSGLSPDGKMVEMIELKDHPFFVGVQGHPEYKSRPNNPHPLFRGFIEAGISHAKKHKK
ncbi:MAG: gamma-glutamyl-gamma-aminobutyrate hydrolase family protein, partial [Lachnospiraceae bacterium]|nr:gamma-glutamyl-gamma-aminobutyrate hydrolase family protein [Lachnospiraceae bacterium]